MNPSAVGATGRLPLAAPVRCVFRGQERGGEGGGGREFGPPAAALGRLSSESSGVEDKLCMRFFSLSLSRPVARGILSVIHFLVAAQKNTFINFSKKERGEKRLKHENNPTSQFSRANRYPPERRRPK